jgi:VanZ family protein
MSEKTWRRVSLYAPLLIWIGVIFYLSGTGGSFQTTSRFIGPLLDFLFPEASPETIAYYHFVIRKGAHLTAYAILALIAFRAFIDVRPRFTSSLVLVALVATLDETNQSFNSARTGASTDVLIDIAGGTIALSLLYAMIRLRAHASRSEPRESIPE